MLMGFGLFGMTSSSRFIFFVGYERYVYFASFIKDGGLVDYLLYLRLGVRLSEDNAVTCEESAPLPMIGLLVLSPCK
jgi:hypothetical protein